MSLHRPGPLTVRCLLPSWDGCVAGDEFVEWERLGVEECEHRVAERVRVITLSHSPFLLGLVGGQVLEAELVVTADKDLSVSTLDDRICRASCWASARACRADRGPDPVLDKPGCLVAASEQLHQLVGGYPALCAQKKLDR